MLKFIILAHLEQEVSMKFPELLCPSDLVEAKKDFLLKSKTS